MDLVEIGKRITTLRATKALTQADLARMAGISRQTLIALEGAKKPEIGLATVTRVLEALGVELMITEANTLPTREQVLARRDADLRRGRR